MPKKQKRSNAKRNYRDEYKKFQGSPKQIKERAARNKRRQQALKSGKVKKGDNTSIHHKTKNVKTTTKVMSRSKNAGIKEKSRLKGSSRKKR